MMFALAIAGRAHQPRVVARYRLDGLYAPLVLPARRGVEADFHSASAGASPRIRVASASAILRIFLDGTTTSRGPTVAFLPSAAVVVGDGAFAFLLLLPNDPLLLLLDPPHPPPVWKDDDFPLRVDGRSTLGHVRLSPELRRGRGTLLLGGFGGGVSIVGWHDGRMDCLTYRRGQRGCLRSEKRSWKNLTWPSVLRKGNYPASPKATVAFYACFLLRRLLPLDLTCRLDSSLVWSLSSFRPRAGRPLRIQRRRLSYRTANAMITQLDCVDRCVHKLA
mmetsp:Transcript_23357/g.69055  ORF Transcript_23357/g.69055 Transcript_23357/m.69055 type:complete len:277 (-) Transcript_23357:146-976(-)